MKYNVQMDSNIIKKIGIEGAFLYGFLQKIKSETISIDGKNGEITFAIKNVEELLCCSKKKAINIISSLESEGLIVKIKKGFGEPNAFLINELINENINSSSDIIINKNSNNVNTKVEEVSNLHHAKISENLTPSKKIEKSNSIKNTPSKKIYKNIENSNSVYFKHNDKIDRLLLNLNKKIKIKNNNLSLNSTCSVKNALRENLKKQINYKEMYENTDFEGNFEKGLSTQELSIVDQIIDACISILSNNNTDDKAKTTISSIKDYNIYSIIEGLVSRAERCNSPIRNPKLYIKKCVLNISSVDIYRGEHFKFQRNIKSEKHIIEKYKEYASVDYKIYKNKNVA